MNDSAFFLFQHQLAWGLYILSALVILAVWWELSSRLGRSDLRDFLRGLALVVIFTPWYATSAREHFAPAALVMVMDLALGDAANGERAALALLLAFVGMTLALLLRRYLRRRRRVRADPWGGKSWR